MNAGQQSKTLLPHHRKDLHRSGLSDETIEAAGIYSVTREEGKELLGFDPRSGGYVIPYPDRNGLPGLINFKPDIPYEGENGKKRKYLRPKGSQSRMYIPAVSITSMEAMQGKGSTLYITEGEKKTLKGAQEGLVCIGLSGVWGWKFRDEAGDSRTIPDLRDVWLKGREIVICFDSDISTNWMVKLAEYTLAEKLRIFGAIVSGIRFPSGPNGEKVGLDDYLVDHTVEEFKALKCVPLDEKPIVTVEAWIESSKDESLDEKPDLKVLLPILAKMPVLEYESVRKEISKTADIRSSVLDREVENLKPKKNEYKTTGDDRDSKIIILTEQYGEPYYTDQKDNLIINQPFWASLFDEENILVYDPDEMKFFRYAKKTGVYDRVTENLIRTEIADRMLQMSHDENVPNLEAKRTTTTLNHIVAHLKGISEKLSTFQKTSKYIHLANGMLVFNDKNEADWVSFSPSFFFRNSIPIPFNETARCDRFLNELLLPAVSKDDAVIIQKYFGLCLHGNNHIQRFLILEGLPGRGKSALVSVLQKLIGRKNITELRTQHLSERFEMYRYLNKLALFGVDVPGNFLSQKGTHVMKALVGGDLIDAEQKGGTGSFQMEGNFCIVITANSRLKVKLDGDLGAWKRRMLIVRFEGDKPAKKIPHFADKLIEAEGPGILNWALKGLRLLLNDIEQHGDIQTSASQEGIVDTLLAESDSLRHFLKDRVGKAEYMDLSVSEIVEAYAEYCPEMGWNPKPITVVHREIEGLMLELFGTAKSNSLKRENKSAKGFRGVCLKNGDANSGQDDLAHSETLIFGGR